MQSSRASDAGEGGDKRPSPGGAPTEQGEPKAEHQPSGQAARSAPSTGGADEAPEDLSDELARIEDRYKRALADLDNYRKRATREVDRRVAEAQEAALREWLQIVDSVERAMRMQPEGPCYEGLRAILQQMDTVLDRQGAQRIGTLGDQFDPERHEAVGVRASGEVPDRTIVEVQRSGFAQGDRVIRPAQVVVARTPEHAH
jgi:molecular chaperone GrpE